MEAPLDLILIALIAIVAQVVNGSMGMGYGVISSSLLLGLGMPPVTMSAAIHTAEVGTTAASGLAHWRLGNVNWPLTLALGIPGAIGGFAGAMLLTSISTSAARPLVSGILIVLGIVILFRFLRSHSGDQQPLRRRYLAPLGGIAGALDATGGGGWGPVTMGTLMSHPPSEPRVVVGSVNASELAVTLAATFGFLLALGWSGIPIAEVIALMTGGMLAAPFGAWLARHIPARQLGLLVATVLLVLNARTLGAAIGLSTPLIVLVMALTTLGCLAVLVGVLRSERAHEAASEPVRHAVLAARGRPS